MRKRTTKNITLISLGAVILALGAWITVPFAVPFTMQTFALFLLLTVFGGKLGCASILLYIALGIIGVPVFSGFNSGISALLGPTGGFIIGFAAAGALYFALQAFLKRHRHLHIVLPFLSLALCYACGTAWYMLYLGSSVSNAAVMSALSVCVLPYILPDCLKIVLALAVSKRLKKAISI